VEYNGVTAIVTGGGHGIGRALAEALAHRGANVVVADVKLERAAKIADRIGGLAIRCDVGDPDSADVLVSAALRTFGPVDIAVSNAGMTDQGHDLDSSVRQVRRIVDVNLLSHV
jgi:NAD(P)-dependent dehydrogenase (short-subunit alcohol dehydrogenase family)